MELRANGMTIHKAIVNNLSNRVSGVNLMTALAGIDLGQGIQALDQLIKQGIVVVTTYELKTATGTVIKVPMYSCRMYQMPILSVC